MSDKSRQLIDFAKIDPANIHREVREQIKNNNRHIEELIKEAAEPDFDLSWETVVSPLDNREEELFDNLFSVAGHLKSVCDNPKLRSAYQKCLLEISPYTTAIKQNQDLFLLLKRLRETGELDAEQQKVLDNYLRDCRLAGIELAKDKRKEFASLVSKHSKLTAKFGENVLDSTDKWKKHIKDESELKGIPRPMIAKYAADAKEQGKDGYLIGLDMPSYQSVMTYADNHSLREDIYCAFMTRASAETKMFAELDNSPLIKEIMLIRHKMAKMLGFDTPAMMFMATNMVRDAADVEEFLNEVMSKVLPVGQKEAKELKEYVLRHKKDFSAWDVSYYSEKLKKEKFNIDAEKMRDYFPLSRVLDGMFGLAGKLFGVSLVEEKNFSTWHKDVRLFKLKDEQGEAIGYLYCDLYAREHKNGGAWMNECKLRRKLGDGTLQLPAAYLVCNFRPPGEGDTLLLHYDVQVLFHEFGHCLHHLLTKINQRGISGINGVPHDMVELPSQLMENWCWDKEFIKNISEHYKTGDPLPTKQLDDLIAARNFHSGLFMLRQLEFSLFDILLHSKLRVEEIQQEKDRAQQLYNELRDKYSPLPQLKEARFPNSFGHIFAGGYAAGYYAYKWAEVMSADIYSMFEHRGIYDKASADSVRRNIFERGGLGDALENFIKVRGREPESGAFLRYNGIAS